MTLAIVCFRVRHYKISEEMKEESDRLGRERAAVLKAAMGLLWKGYSDHAWGYDEVGKARRVVEGVVARALKRELEHSGGGTV